jgi:hypothetical protein
MPAVSSEERSEEVIEIPNTNMFLDECGSPRTVYRERGSSALNVFLAQALRQIPVNSHPTNFTMIPSPPRTLRFASVREYLRALHPEYEFIFSIREISPTLNSL